MVKPITPGEIVFAKANTIPNEVMEIINEMIAEKWNGSYSKFKQKDLVARIQNRIAFVTKEMIFEKGWLDFEDIYRAVGWKVYYDKPAYFETYDATFEFSK